MTRLFADTSGFFAAFSTNDARHEDALAALNDSVVLVTTRLIVLETVSLLTKRLSPHHARQWYDALKPGESLVIREISPALLREAEKLWRRSKDKEWDLIDCYSFCLMRRERIKTAWSFDRHFAQAGFRLAAEF